MLLVIPSIFIVDNKSYLKIEGEPGTEKYYSHLSNKPLDLCKLLRKENAKTLYIDFTDDILFKRHYDFLISLTSCVDIPLQVSTRLSKIEECEKLLDNGVFRIFIDRLAIDDPDGIRQLVEKYTPSRIVGNIVMQYGKNYLSQISDFVDDLSFMLYLKELGVNRIVYINIDWTNHKADLDLLKRLAIETQMKITLKNGIHNSAQLWELNELVDFGVDSVILADALYNNKFPCQKIWRLIEADLER